MNHLLTYSQLFEKLQMVTANWSIISNEGSFEKKEESGYLVFSKDGTFSIIYNKKEPKEEGRIEFYTAKEKSTDKKSVCECKITTPAGQDRVKKGFGDITPSNVWEIISIFFDFCDLEKAQKNEVDKFLMGFSKSLQEVHKSEDKDQLPPSFKLFHKYIKEWTKNTHKAHSISHDSYNFESIIKKFVDYLKA